MPISSHSLLLAHSPFCLFSFKHNPNTLHSDLSSANVTVNVNVILFLGPSWIPCAVFVDAVITMHYCLEAFYYGDMNKTAAVTLLVIVGMQVRNYLVNERTKTLRVVAPTPTATATAAAGTN